MTGEQAYEWLAPKLHTSEREALDVIRKDAERYRWLAARLLAADFDYNGDGVQALVFELPTGCAVSADCDATIDEAMLAAPAVG